MQRSGGIAASFKRYFHLPLTSLCRGCRSAHLSRFHGVVGTPREPTLFKDRRYLVSAKVDGLFHDLDFGLGGVDQVGPYVEQENRRTVKLVRVLLLPGIQIFSPGGKFFPQMKPQFSPTFDCRGASPLKIENAQLLKGYSLICLKPAHPPIHTASAPRDVKKRSRQARREPLNAPWSRCKDPRALLPFAKQVARR